jgi:kynureninase
VLLWSQPDFVGMVRMFGGMPEAFHIPHAADGRQQHYFCGNSLGLMPKTADQEVQTVLSAWRELGVEGHFKGPAPWMPYHERARAGLAQVLGAKPIEVVAMNTLTVNLHLLMCSFYKPKGTRRKILMEARAFPSDRHAMASQIALHGGDVARDLIELAPLPGANALSAEQVLAAIAEQGEELALLMFPGVQYATGQAFDLAQLSQAAHSVGAYAGFDLAHAVGNLELQLHASGADFAVWCSYKYLNSGPGAVAGAFVHERHAHSALPRLAGWWGHRSDTRFLMGPEFEPTPGADGWQLSNPPILSMAPLIASLALFSSVGMPALRARGLDLSARLLQGLDQDLADYLEVLTPRSQRGCQLSLRVRAGRAAGRECFDALHRAGIVCDWREPDVIRVAPVPMYNTEQDVDALLGTLRARFRRVAS